MSAARQPAILVTGGLGYIGSHTVVSLSEAGYRVVIVDNLSNSSIEVLDRIEQLCRSSPATYCGDVRDLALLGTVLERNPVQCAIHFAGLKAVGESVAVPLEYYDVNVNGTLILLRALEAAGVRRVVFSSSATVYGDPATVPVDEDQPTAPASPYGRSKRAAEDILADACGSDPRWAVACLRYFNPAGAHPSGTIGERPNGIPNNLMPYISQVASGARASVRVFGSDYPTPDGTGVRDYVHVMDLAEAHVRAVEHVLRHPGFEVLNIGTGQGYSVLDVLQAYQRAHGRPVPHEFAPRRPGDVASCFADVSRAEARLGWRASRSLDDMCRDAANFEASLAEHARAHARTPRVRHAATAAA
ncbi:MAG TPA: UDP-glucose 4-epimerase GalE [Luteimonas sp.]|nr:UDP-glucose 4-epimerase GalE [Luteimonas sp.]